MNEAELCVAELTCRKARIFRIDPDRFLNGEIRHRNSFIVFAAILIQEILVALFPRLPVPVNGGEVFSIGVRKVQSFQPSPNHNVLFLRRKRLDWFGLDSEEDPIQLLTSCQFITTMLLDKADERIPLGLDDWNNGRCR
ncbi:MAG: hypothetical protein ABJN26_25275 [Stappiaceae bacterium]